MAAEIRLKRTGKSKRPYYRIVVLDSKDPRDGSYLDCLGHYQPIEKDSPVKLDMEKYREWVGKGAIVSSAVRDIARRIRKAG